MTQHSSSTLAIPEVSAVPRHVAIIMDGNGRWASKRMMPRVAGHSEGLGAVRKIVQECRKLGVEYLTVFAFSSENWRRPPEEVGFLMKLFLKSLKGEVSRLAENDIALRLIGDLTRFDSAIQEMVKFSEEKTAACKGLTFTIAANYGGRWDILEAMRKCRPFGETWLTVDFQKENPSSWMHDHVCTRVMRETEGSMSKPLANGAAKWGRWCVRGVKSSWFLVVRLPRA